MKAKALDDEFAAEQNWRSWYAPRYEFFIYVDENILNRATNHQKSVAAQSQNALGGYYMKLVRADMVFSEVEETQRRKMRQAKRDALAQIGMVLDDDFELENDVFEEEYEGQEDEEDKHDVWKWYKNQNVMEPYEYLLNPNSWYYMEYADIMDAHPCTI